VRAVIGRSFLGATESPILWFPARFVNLSTSGRWRVDWLKIKPPKNPQRPVTAVTDLDRKLGETSIVNMVREQQEGLL
jgi:hypothetical protein